MAIYSTWWTVLCVDPPARLARTSGPVRRFWLAMDALALGLAAAAFFALPLIASSGLGRAMGIGASADLRMAPVGAALLYYVSTVLEQAAGRKWPDELRTWLAGSFGPLRDLCCAVALTLGRYVPTHRPIYLYLGLEILCLELLRHHPTDGADRPSSAPNPDDVFVWWDWYSWGQRLVRLLIRHRVSTRLVGGAEFRMVVFMVAPLTTVVAPRTTVPMTVVAGLLILIGEFRERRKLWRFSRDTGPAPAPGMSAHTVPAARPEPTTERYERATAAKTMIEVGHR